MEYFRPDGHLTDEALAALVRSEPLDELVRLELAEHLAYCDDCLQRYTDALAGTPLLMPEHSCRETRASLRGWPRRRRQRPSPTAARRRSRS